MTLNPTSSKGSGGGGSGTVTSVASANTAISVASPTTAVVLTLATLDVIAADGPPAANWSNNSKKITGLANGTLATDAAALGQVGVTSVTAGDTSIVVGGTGAAPTIVTGTLDVIAGDHPPAADWSNNSHKITSVLDPTLAQDAATKAYVDNAITGVTWKASVAWATTAALPANTYANGASGVGATLTATGNGAITIDGNTPAVADRVLVKNEVSGLKNGIYVVTTVGTAGTPYVLTRATDFDQAAEITAGDVVPVVGGTTNADTSWMMTTTGAIVVGTTALVFSQFSGVVSVAATDTSIVVAGTKSAPTVATGTLDVIATQHPAAANWSNNSKKITSLANGSAAQDAAAFGQIPTGLAEPLAVAAGYKNWTGTPQSYGTTAAAAVSGQVYITALWLPFGVVITNIVFGVAIAAAGTNPTGFFVGLAGPTGTMLAQSNNLNAAGGPTTTGPIAMALSGTYTTASGDSSTGLFFLVLLQNGSWGTTQPTFLVGSPTPVAASKAIGANPILSGAGVTTGQTALQANGNGIAGGIGTTNAKTYWGGTS